MLRFIRMGKMICDCALLFCGSRSLSVRDCCQISFKCFFSYHILRKRENGAGF